jgi:hypothetical protein
LGIGVRLGVLFLNSGAFPAISLKKEEALRIFLLSPLPPCTPVGIILWVWLFLFVCSGSEEPQRALFVIAVLDGFSGTGLTIETKESDCL